MSHGGLPTAPVAKDGLRPNGEQRTVNGERKESSHGGHAGHGGLHFTGRPAPFTVLCFDVLHSKFCICVNCENCGSECRHGCRSTKFSRRRKSEMNG